MTHTRSTRRPTPPAIGDYALLSDCHASALVSRGGSIDWCCMPRFDSEPCLSRLLDYARGSYCSIAPRDGDFSCSRRYVDGTLVLVTRFETATGAVDIFDLLVHTSDEQDPVRRRLLRIVEGVRGRVELEAVLRLRIGFEGIEPWIRRYDADEPSTDSLQAQLFTAVGSDKGMVIASDLGLAGEPPYTLCARATVRQGERRRLSITFARPEQLDDGPERREELSDADELLEATIEWWRSWNDRLELGSGELPQAVRRSALVLKALHYAPTGAIIAAPTTSLPEGLNGSRTWDYRFSWVRDAAFSASALLELGCQDEAFRFRKFIERSSAGSADQLSTLYRVDGDSRVREVEIDDMQGYRDGGPVRVGNHAARQIQLDVIGETLELSWIWCRRGLEPEDSYWAFLVDLVERVSTHWRSPDHGIWEMRTAPAHYVHSKVMCWRALDCGIGLAQALDRKAPIERWQQARRQVRDAVECYGYDRHRGIFVQSFDNLYLDASLLRLPAVGFIDHRDQRMLRTTDAIEVGLADDGLLRRYDSPDGLPGTEGAFLPCTFWLAECLAHQGFRERARRTFESAVATANDLGLFAEQYDPKGRQLWSNFPQGLTHLSHINAALALRNAAAPAPDEPSARSR